MADTAKRQSQSKVGCRTHETAHPRQITGKAIDLLQNTKYYEILFLILGKKFTFLGVPNSNIL
jgi:hypothetical protein